MGSVCSWTAYPTDCCCEDNSPELLGTDYLLCLHTFISLCFAFWNPSIIFTSSSILASHASCGPRFLGNAVFQALKLLVISFH